MNNFETAVHDALDGGKILIATHNVARVEVLALMRQLAAYVQASLQCGPAGLLGSGFEAVRAPSPAGALPAPQNPRLSLTDKSGELMLKFDRVTNGVSYSVQTLPAATGPWGDEVLSTGSRVEIGGLMPDETPWARACANGSADASEWSAPTTAMAL